MGFKRYLLWYDAVYGATGYWFNIDYNISSDCSVVTNSLVWTVDFISLKYTK